MLILGINAFHGDSAACVVAHGELVAAVEEERFRRIKHWAGFPAEAIAYCLREAGITLDDVEHVAINSNPRANLARKLWYALAKPSRLGDVVDRVRRVRARTALSELLNAGALPGRFSGRTHHVEHHLAHLASSYLVSPFERAVCVSVDGFGDFTSTAWGVGEGGRIRIDARVAFPHSLGVFYQALTQYLGFHDYGDEYKVMGLAPYGEPGYVDELRRVLRVHGDATFSLGLDYFRHARERVQYRWSGGAPEVAPLYSGALGNLLGPRRQPGEPIEQRHKDIARSCQELYEEALFALLGKLHREYGCDALALAGGCAMNSVANGRIPVRTPFKQVYIPPAAGDAGGAIGAAMHVARRFDSGERTFVMSHAYWGPGFDASEIEALLAENRRRLEAVGCEVIRLDDEDALCRHTAAAIADGAVAGWFQGRMEWGPRALGNRSILCDPRRVQMQGLLNRKIKRRESFRPFAPSVLRERTADWFETEGDVPFMSQVFQVRAEKRAEIPAVTHVDGSGRLQTVSRQSNPLYYRLIRRFEEVTGTPMLLNTSFNENEPVVCLPTQALDCFLRTDMDVIVLGSHVVSRST